MRLARRAVLAALVLTTVVVTPASPAFAAPPGNDTLGGRTVVGAIPFSETLDTSEATTDADDAELNANCGAPATDASVWYEFTAASDSGMVVDISQSDYTAGAIIATGGPGSWFVEACAPGAVGWFATAGTTYTILAFDDQFDGGGNGGMLNITIDTAPPPPTIDVTVSPRGRFDSKTGSAFISGTVTCEGQADFAFLEAQLSQRVGRFIIRGFGFSDVTCDGATRPWSLEIVGDNGRFAGGKAASVTFAVACGVFDCGVDFEEHVVQLSGRKR